MNPDPASAPVPPTPPPLGATPPKKGPNWFIILPCGCATLIGLFALAGVALVFFVFGAMKSTDAYKLAVEKAKASSQVQEALGTPIAEGLVPSGSVNIDNGVGSAKLDIPISGPKGAGTIHVDATKPSGGEWNYSVLSVETPSGTINLLE